MSAFWLGKVKQWKLKCFLHYNYVNHWKTCIHITCVYSGSFSLKIMRTFFLFLSYIVLLLFSVSFAHSLYLYLPSFSSISLSFQLPLCLYLPFSLSTSLYFSFAPYLHLYLLHLCLSTSLHCSLTPSLSLIFFFFLSLPLSLHLPNSLSLPLSTSFPLSPLSVFR